MHVAWFRNDCVSFHFVDCDAVMSDSYGFFASPGYTHHGMAPDTHCTYSIEAPTDHTIVLMYSVKMGDEMCEGQCCDYLEVRQGLYKVRV